MLTAYLPNIEPDVYDAVISEMEAAADAITRAEEFANESNGDESTGAKV